MDHTHCRWRRLRRAYYLRAVSFIFLSGVLLLFGLGHDAAAGVSAALGLAGLFVSLRQAPHLAISLRRCLPGSAGASLSGRR